MSRYRPVLYGINSWWRRSKKSKEITVFQWIRKLTKCILNLSKSFYQSFRRILDLKRRKEFNFRLHIFNYSIWMPYRVFNYDLFFHPNVDITTCSIFHKKKLTSCFKRSWLLILGFSFFNEFMKKIVHYKWFS